MILDRIDWVSVGPILLVLAVFLYSSIVIDLLTLLIYGIIKLFYYIFKRDKYKLHFKKYDPPQRFKVSVIIPAYKEEKNIKKTLRCLFNQTLQPARVIVVDDNSPDRTTEICMQFAKKHKNLTVLRQKQNRGKAFNVTYILKNFELEEITIVLDADTFLTKTYLEEIVKPFVDKKVVIATGMSTPVKSPNFWGKIIYNGSIFQYKFFGFRKSAQSIRNAVSVICGDSAAYRTSFLKKMGGLPQGTQTEDMDITWRALEKGYKIVYMSKARADSQDASTVRGSWKQITRWYAGAFQCLIVHNKKLVKAKPLTFTTIVPSLVDSFVYSAVFLIVAPAMYLFFPNFTIGFYIADFIFTSIAILYLDWKYFFHLPEIYFIKFMWSTAWLFSSTKTFIQFARGRRSWDGGWNRDFYAKRKNRGKTK